LSASESWVWLQKSASESLLNTKRRTRKLTQEDCEAGMNTKSASESLLNTKRRTRKLTQEDCEAGLNTKSASESLRASESWV